jgi:ribosome-associated heat shock protein Hsp15
VSTAAAHDGQPAETQVRLDKWLWAARFFKTRQLAVAAINGGKVQVNGNRVKPGRTIAPGARITIHKETLEWDLEVVAVSHQRRPAPEAAQLYRETEASVLRRQEQVRQRREAGTATTGERPTKRDRRQIQRFTLG